MRAPEVRRMSFPEELEQDEIKELYEVLDSAAKSVINELTEEMLPLLEIIALDLKERHQLDDLTKFCSEILDSLKIFEFEDESEFDFQHIFNFLCTKTYSLQIYSLLIY